MSDFNSQKNRAVWFDVPVADLDRATAFYAAVLAVRVTKQTVGDSKFSVLDHQDGNGGCLVLNPDEVGRTGVMIYLNADGRIREAVREVDRLGGEVLSDVHSVGPHGFRAVILDSEGNRIALHSNTDA